MRILVSLEPKKILNKRNHPKTNGGKYRKRRRKIFFFFAF